MKAGSEAGFSLVALVATMTITLILMGAAMPSWKYVVQNEREQELYFRGDQIARAIERYQKKVGGAPPPSLEVLVKGRYLRKAYKDPMTKDGKWKFIRPGEVTVPRPGTGTGGHSGPPGASPSPGASPRMGQDMRFSGSTQVGPFIGVASTSTETSLRVMNGQDQYDEWLFVAGRPRFLGKSGPEIPVGNAAPAEKPAGGSAPPPGRTN